ncbi:hypothetical protein [Streptomyces sp. RKAG290]|uniref:hypothetical protein n=1 Tax=Streptomyces sp. RKAG290 TaxID=2888348 RepID=UPI0020343E94|nr:hypothetical protein [Streptomyces sp. RKAG290]MCM2412566.1 hypothetical protein [Streptomyces sp. RKAG290]
MGIESDQLVFDYLSRVGDLAQQQQLSSGTRMRLVTALRGEIDRQRVKQAADTPGAVRRIIGTLGTPDELVAAAATSADGTVALPQAPDWGAAEAGGIPRPRRAKLRKDSSRKGASEVRGEASGASPGPAPSAPHRAGTDELGPSGSEADWWRVDPGPFGEFGAGTDVPGFRGGVEIPAVLRPPVAAEDEDEEFEDDEEEPEEGYEAAAPARRRRLPRLRRRRSGEERAPRGFSHPLLLLAAGLLVAGAVMGSLLALAGGWLLAYSSRRMSRTEAKWAAMGVPGLVLAGGLVWLWGRLDGRWGKPIPEHGMADALSGVWPVVVRVAAVASALFLVWRARRR